jgi:heme A synthase
MPGAINSPDPADDSLARPRPSSTSLIRYAWAVLTYNLLVIAWGAYVRASGSGAGCGRHWPLCNGDFIPRADNTKTLVEASHRVTSGLALIAVVVLMVWTLRTVPRGHRARKASIASTVFIFTEALVGAGLVLFELVASDKSMKRGLSMILHLDNTFLLLASLAVTAWTLTRDPAVPVRPDRDAVRAPRPRWLGPAVYMGLFSVLVLGSSGAIAALGDTLFPAASLREGFAQDLSPLAHVFLRLRVLHPFIALIAGGVVFASATLVRMANPSALARSLSRVVTLVFASQFALGLLNVTLLAPIGLQLAHLLMADATWIALVLMGWEALYAAPALAVCVTRQELPDVAQMPIMSRNGPAPMSDVPPSTSKVDPVT